MPEDVVVPEDLTKDVIKDVVVVGRIGGAYGVRGWVHVRSFTDPPENLLSYSPWLIQKSGIWEKIEPVLAKPHGQGFVAQFPNVDTRDRAGALKSKEIGVHRDVLPVLDDEDEFYWRDLIGLEVVNVDGCSMGTVSHLMETPAHDVLVIAAGPNSDSGGEILIPFTAQFVRSVDLRTTRLVVDW